MKPQATVRLDDPALSCWFGFQTTESVGQRRWRDGPAQWDVGPHNEEAPPGHGWADAADRGVEVSVRAVGDRTTVIEVEVPGDDVEAVSAWFPALPGEAWLGFGERSDQVVRTAGVVENYVGEGPYQEYEYPFLGAIVPSWALRQRRDASYFPLPFVLSTAGYGVAIEEDGVSYVRLRPDGAAAWSVEVEATSLRLRIFGGPTALDALGRYVAWQGPQPEPEAWWFGPWYQTGHANHTPLGEEKDQLTRLRAARAPVSAAETHCRYLPLGEHRGWEDEERARTAFFHDQGLAVLSYINPLVGVSFEDVYHASAVMQRPDGGPYTFEAYAGGRNPPVALETHFDFTLPEARMRWAAVAAELVDAGYDGWMEDFGEYTPLDAVMGGMVVGTEGHNRYPTQFHSTASEVAADLEQSSGRRIARFARSGWSGTARCTPIVWGGDPTTGWGFDGLASAVIEGLSAGASGVAMWGSDIGGFMSSVEALTPELLCRWIQFGAMSPVMRTKAGGIQPPDHVRPQIWDDEILDQWVRWSALHTQLNPYLAATHARYRSTGRPLMTALALVHPEEPLARVDDQYLLGLDLMVAPVLSEGARSRNVHLFDGPWVNLWQAAEYDPATRGLVLTGESAAIGPGQVEVPAPLDQIPVFVRGGAVLPLLSPAVDSLSPYPAPGVVNGADRDGERVLLCFPYGDWQGEVGPGEPVRSTLSDEGVWTLDLSGAPRRRYVIQADLGLSGRPMVMTTECDGGSLRVDTGAI